MTKRLNPGATIGILGGGQCDDFTVLLSALGARHLPSKERECPAQFQIQLDHALGTDYTRHWYSCPRRLQSLV